MSQEVMVGGSTLMQQPEQHSPFARGLPASVNAGAVSIEVERAVAEARGQMQLAKMFPRNLNAAYAEIMDACKLHAMANVAFYTLPQGGQKVTGPSIKLIEQIAQSCGNFEWGHRELGRQEAGPGPTDFGRSEVEVYAWDKEKNIRSIRQITVLHVLDTRDGPRKLRDQRDIDNKIANVASKQMRGRLAALLPKWLIEAAQEECRKTLTGNNNVPIAERVRKMSQAFAGYGVTVELLERSLGHKLESVTVDELADLLGIYNAIKEGTPPDEFFGEFKAAEAADATGAALAATAKAGAEAAPPAKQPPANSPAADRKAKAAAKAAQQAEQQPEPKAEAAQQESSATEKPDSPVKESAPEPEQSAAAPADSPAADDGEELF